MLHTQTTRDSNATNNLLNEPPAECKDAMLSSFYTVVPISLWSTTS